MKNEIIKMKNKMRKLMYVCLAVAGIVLAGCSGKGTLPEGVCHISGTIPADYNGKRIFLVPLYGPTTAEYVDSIEVQDGHFEFTKDTVMMAKILMDYHYRMGVQQLLVVTEPGEVEVVIDSISSAKGTPQNDSLQQWKDATEKYHRELVMLRKANRMAEADSLHLEYKKLTRQLAANMKEGVLHDFLEGMFPLTYKQKMPDGSIVTMDADTHEPVE